MQSEHLIHGTRQSPFYIMFIVCCIADIMLNMYVLYYIRYLKHVGCECAMNWQRTFIETFVVVSTIIMGVLAVMIAFAPDDVAAFFLQFSHLLVPLGIIVMLVSMVYAFVTIDYVFSLSKKACPCAQRPAKNVMMILSILSIISYTISITRFMTLSSALFVLSQSLKK